MELKLCQSSHPLPCKSSSFRANSTYKHFSLLPKRCKYHIQELFSNGQQWSSSIQFLVHVVKEDETLTSLSKLYGVPIYEIAAANKEIIDVNLVFEGQHLNIPSYVTPYSQTNQREKIRLPKIDVSETSQRFKLCGNDINQKMLYVLSCRHLPYAKTSGYFLVLVPLIGFCIRCIMNAFHHRVARNKLQDVRQASGSMRWKLALRDLSDPDALYSDSRPEIENVTDDREHLQSEELSRAYAKLDGDYQKFLSECGMSKWGYWRGGTDE
ncbi:uncharacterized protein [Solanum tuberosum]|uniref:YkuD n=1 Tax=Solanum tuberosum TaxID=4113 RepID=M1D2Y8_SOLTU|nr:PREDICTED: uncharacterized protein LOC102602767 isoform X2 [Solanum tuberosum]KAH0746053.1 hypothetical protein KY285_007710 [Solanum tuberosum]